MIQLLWGLVNICLLLYFIFICFKATRVVREKLGLLVAIFLVFGILSFTGMKNEPNQKKPNPGVVQFSQTMPGDAIRSTNFVSVDLEKTLISTYSLNIDYAHDERQQLVPVGASSRTTGFVSGTLWKPSNISIQTTPDGTTFTYEVFGSLEWRLLGATMYTQVKMFKGAVKMK